MALTDDQIIMKAFDQIGTEKPFNNITRADIREWLDLLRPLITEDTKDPETEQQVRPIVFIGDFEQYSSVDYAEKRAKELAEAGHKVTMVNVLVDDDGNPFGLQYEAQINVTVAEATDLEV